jgi:hypothetical protein
MTSLLLTPSEGLSIDSRQANGARQPIEQPYPNSPGRDAHPKVPNQISREKPVCQLVFSGSAELAVTLSASLRIGDLLRAGGTETAG